MKRFKFLILKKIYVTSHKGGANVTCGRGFYVDSLESAKKVSRITCMVPMLKTNENGAGVQC